MNRQTIQVMIVLCISFLSWGAYELYLIRNLTWNEFSPKQHAEQLLGGSGSMTLVLYSPGFSLTGKLVHDELCSSIKWRRAIHCNHVKLVRSTDPSHFKYFRDGHLLLIKEDGSVRSIDNPKDVFVFANCSSLPYFLLAAVLQFVVLSQARVFSKRQTHSDRARFKKSNDRL